MNLFRIVSSLVAGVYVISVGGLWFFRKLRSPESFYFALFSVTLGIWNVMELAVFVHHHQLSLWLARVAYSGSAFIPFFFASFVMEDVDYRPSWVRVPLLALSSCFAVCALTPWMLADVHSNSALLPIEEIPGPLYDAFSVFFLFGLSYALVPIFVRFRHFNGIRRNHFRYLCLGVGLGVLAAANYFAYIIKSNLPPLFYVLEVMMTTVFALVIHRQHLIDLELLVRNALINLLSGVCLVIPFLAGFFLSHGTWTHLTLALVMLPVFNKAFDPLHSVIRRLVDRVVFKNRYGYLESLQKLGQENHRVTSLTEFIPILTEDIIRKVQVRSCTILIHLEEVTARPYFKATKVLDAAGHIVSAPPWPENVARAMLGLFKPETRSILRANIDPMPEILSSIDGEFFEAAFPLRIDGRNFGLIAVGPKQDFGSLLNQNDMQSLEYLASVMSEMFWTHLAQYQQLLVIETALHDAINYLRPARYALELNEPSESMLQSLVQGMELLKDLRSMNQLSLTRQSGTRWPPQRLKVRELIQKTCEAMRVVAEAKGLKVESDLSEDLPPVVGDLQMFDRSIANLVGNAIKYTSKGQVVVSAKRADKGGLEICIADSGAGMPEEDLPHIFEPFYRVAHTEQLEEGTGLGLVIVKNCITGMGGRVYAKSKVGVGSQFFIWLPEAAPAPQALQGAKKAA